MKQFLNTWLTLLFIFTMIAAEVFGVISIAFGLASMGGYNTTSKTYVIMYLPSIVIFTIGSITCWFLTRRLDQPVWLKIIAISSFFYSIITLQYVAAALFFVFQQYSFIAIGVLALVGVIKLFFDASKNN